MKFIRSRSYHKNDNAYVEQKNGNVIRREIGYRRLDAPEVLKVMNELYEYLALHRNFFVFQKKLISKERHGSRYIRKHDHAKTPINRVLADFTVSKKVKDNLTEIRDTINPRILRTKINHLRATLFKLQTQYGSEVRQPFVIIYYVVYVKIVNVTSRLVFRPDTPQEVVCIYENTTSHKTHQKNQIVPGSVE